MVVAVAQTPPPPSQPTIFCLWVSSAEVVLAACPALKRSCSSLLVGVPPDGVTLGTLEQTAPPAGVFGWLRSWQRSPKRSRKVLTP